MNANDIMTRHAVTVKADTTLVAAIALMSSHQLSGLPVVDDQGRMLGILTEGDLLHRIEAGTGKKQRSKLLDFMMGPGRAAADYVAATSRVVGDLMTQKVVTVTRDTSLETVVSLMETHRIRRIPVVEAGMLLGIVSRMDIVRAVGQVLSNEPVVSHGDTAIELRLRAEVDRQSWSQAGAVTIAVKDGAVTLDGVIYDERCRGAFIAAAQNSPGVTHVTDKLTWIDPTTGLYMTAA